MYIQGVKNTQTIIIEGGYAALYLLFSYIFRPTLVTILFVILGLVLGFLFSVILENESFFTQLNLGKVKESLHSPLLLLGVLVTAFYVVTSTQSPIGKALVDMFLLTLVMDLLAHLSSKTLRQRWFAQTTLTDTELSLFVLFYTVLFGILSLIAIRT